MWAVRWPLQPASWSRSRGIISDGEGREVDNHKQDRCQPEVITAAFRGGAAVAQTSTREIHPRLIAKRSNLAVMENKDEVVKLTLGLW